MNQGAAKETILLVEDNKETSRDLLGSTDYYTFPYNNLNSTKQLSVRALAFHRFIYLTIESPGVAST